MFDRQARETLENLLASLRNWEQSVPVQAKGFHRQRKLLLDDIDAELRRLHSRQSLAEGYVQRYQPLARLATKLAGLLREAQHLESELDALQTLFAEEREVADYGAGCCQRWRDELWKLSARCEREAELPAALREVEDIGLAIRLHSEALRTLHSADALLRELGPAPEAAALDAEVRQARLALAAGRVSLDGVRRIKQLAAPLDEWLKQPAPQEWQSLSAVLTEIRRWDNALGLPSQPERSLEQRRRQLGGNGRLRDPAEARALLAEAEALLALRLQQGRQRRESKRLALEDLCEDLVSATGPQPEIRVKLDGLKAGGAESANRHEDWLDKFTEAEAYFHAIANEQELALQKRLRERCADLQAQVRDLQEQPLAESLRIEAETLERQAETLALPQETPTLLRALRHSNELARQIAELGRLAQQERQALAVLRQRGAALCEHLSALTADSLPPGDMEEAHSLLAELTAADNLADAVQAAEAFLERLSAEQQSWQARLETLKQRLLAFNQEHLKPLIAEELHSRLADLVYGIPTPPGRQDLTQLRAACQLFDRLEQQARRRAAQLVEHDLALLEPARHSHPNPQEAAAVLDAVRALGDEQPVPAKLRLRLRRVTAGVRGHV